MIPYSAISTSTIANTATETAFAPSGVGTLTIDPSLWSVGRVFHLHARGYFSTALVAPTLVTKVKIGTGIIATATVSTLVSSALNNGFFSDLEIVCRSTGTNGSICALGDLYYTSTASTQGHADFVNTGIFNFDTTVPQTISITDTWNTASTSNSASVAILTLDID